MLPAVTLLAGILVLRAQAQFVDPSGQDDQSNLRLNSPLLSAILGNVQIPVQLNNNPSDPNTRTIQQFRVIESSSQTRPQSVPIRTVPVQPVPQQPTPVFRYEAQPVQVDDTIGVAPVPVRNTGQQQMATINCAGARYLVPVDQAQYYSCCGSQTYYWPTHQCTSRDGGMVQQPPQSVPIPVSQVPVQQIPIQPAVPSQPQLQPVPPQQQGQSGPPAAASLTCNGVQFLFQESNALSRYACCGRSIYDMTNSRCNDSSMPNFGNVMDFSRFNFPFNPFFGGMQPQQQPAQPQPVPQPQPQPLPQPLPRPSVPVMPVPINPPTPAGDVPIQPAPQIDIQQLCSSTYTCCQGFKPEYDPNRSYRCCPGAGPFDPAVSSCVAAN